MSARRYAVLVLGLLLFGLARLPFERQLTRQLTEAHFLQSKLNRDVRAQTGQMGFVAALSGFRSVVADMLWIQIFTEWQDTQWGRIKFLCEAATSLQPRSVLFWDMSAWHMAWNASVAAMNDPKQPRETLRIMAAKQYIRVGEDFLLRGTEYNPDRAKLFEKLGDLYRDKMHDPCKAAWAYYEAAKRPDAMRYVHRMAVYQLAKCPGHDEETYRIVRGLYLEGEKERLPSLLILLDELQKKLNVPVEQRIDIRPDMEKAMPKWTQPAGK